jgi:hypothetical protein
MLSNSMYSAPLSYNDSQTNISGEAVFIILAVNAAGKLLLITLRYISLKIDDKRKSHSSTTED